MIKDLIIYTPMYVTLFWALVLLFSKHRNNVAKQFLGVFMVFAFIVYLSHAVFFKEQNSVLIFFDPLYIFASLSVYPLYYWYLKLLTSENIINYRNLRMFIPASVFGMAALIMYLVMTPGERENYINLFLFKKPVAGIESVKIEIQKAIYFIAHLVFIIQVFLFLIYGTRLVKKYNERIENFYSNLENRTIIWVKMLLISFVVTSVASIVSRVVGRTIFLEFDYLLIIPSAIFSILLFIIGFQGHLQNYTVADLLNDENQYPETDYKNMNRELLKKRLLQLFEDEGIYRDPHLKLTRVSAMLQTNRTYISNLINSEFSCSFSEFVNRHRISDAKQVLANSDYSDYSLNSISDKVGFGSLATFIRVFKKAEGIPPGKYRQRFLQ